MQYLKNSAWMISEYCLRIISGIFVTIYIARYLGPEDYGILSYSLAILSILMVISRLGMDSILVRDIAIHKDKIKPYLGTAFTLMIIAALVNISAVGILVYFFESSIQTKLYLWIISTGLLFQPFLAVDYGFQAQVKAKYSFIAKSCALVLSAAVKIYLVWIKAGLLYFAIAFALDYALIALMLIATHFIKKQPSFLFAFQMRLVKPLLKSAWPMVLAALATVLYMRLDQIMIKSMLDTYQLGLYSAATKIYEAWIIITSVISISLLPAIVKLKEGNPERYRASLVKLFALVFWPSILIAIILSLTGKWVILVSFGSEYLEAYEVLSIVMWTSSFAALGFVSARYLTVENLEKKIIQRTFLALVLNLGLNFLMIPIYGINGAAVATLISIVIANYFLDYFDIELQEQLIMKNKALLGIELKRKKRELN